MARGAVASAYKRAFLRNYYIIITAQYVIDSYSLKFYCLSRDNVALGRTQRKDIGVVDVGPSRAGSAVALLGLVRTEEDSDRQFIYVGYITEK